MSEDAINALRQVEDRAYRMERRMVTAEAALKVAREENGRLRAALRRIDGINDNMSCFNPDIDKVVMAALAGPVTEDSHGHR